MWTALAVTVVTGIRRVLDLVATRYLRRAFVRTDGVHGDLSRAHVGLLPPGIQLRALQMASATGGFDLSLSCARAGVRLSPIALLFGRIVGRVDIDGPTATFTRARQADTGSKQASETPKQAPLSTIDPRRMLGRLPAFAVRRIRIRRAGLDYRERVADEGGELRIHHVSLTVHGVATRSELTDGRPVRVTGSGRVGRQGRFDLSVEANPYAAQLTFEGRAELREFALRELEGIIAPRTDLRIPQGTIDLFVVFRCEGGRVQGGVKPVLKDVRIEAADRSWLDRTKAWLTDKTISVTSGKVEGQRTVATIIPILGTLDSPDVQLLPAILGVIRNAFVIGLREGFENLPPEIAPSHEGFFKQAKAALSRSAGPPRAQPPKDGH